jgi:O-antigen ligase
MPPRQRFLNLLVWGVLVAVALTPLIVDRQAMDDAFMTPKWAWLSAWGGLALAALLARAASERPIVFSLQPLWIAIVVWIGWYWIAALWARSGGLAIDRAWRMTSIFLAFWLALHVLRTHRTLARLAWVWTGLGTATALWVLRDDAMQAWAPYLLDVRANLPDWRGYLTAGLGNTNHVGDLLALTLLPTLALFGETRRPRMIWLFGASAVLLPAGLIVCYSVGSNLGLILGAVVMVVLVLRHVGARWFLRRWRRWVALSIAWGALIAFFNADQPLNPHRPGILAQGFGSDRWHEGWPTRLAIWGETREMIRTRPLMGVGTGNFTYVFPEMDAASVRENPELAIYRGMYTNAAHNELLQAWAEQGIVGLLLLVGMLAIALFTLLHRLSHASRWEALARITLAGLLIAWIGHAQMNFVLQHPAGALSLFAILLGILVERQTRERHAAAMPPLVNAFGPLELTLQWRTMRRPTGIGVAFVLSETRAAFLMVALLIAAAGWMVHASRPVVAQREYRRAMEAMGAGDDERAIGHFEAGLEIDPDAVDLRSRYSAVLIDRFGEPAEGLAQLATVRERLNSSELYLREAKGLEQLGKTKEAEAAYRRYLARTGGTPGGTESP